MGRYPRYLDIKSILLKIFDDILLLASCLSRYITERKLQILQTNQIFEKIAHFYPIFVVHLRSFIAILLRGNCNVLVL